MLNSGLVLVYCNRMFLFFPLFFCFFNILQLDAKLRLRTQMLTAEHNISRWFFRTSNMSLLIFRSFSPTSCYVVLLLILFYYWAGACVLFFCCKYGKYIVFLSGGTVSSVCAELLVLLFIICLLSVSLHDRYTHKWVWRWWRCLCVPWTAWQPAFLVDVTHCWLWISLFCTFSSKASRVVCIGLI